MTGRTRLAGLTALAGRNDRDGRQRGGGPRHRRGTASHGWPGEAGYSPDRDRTGGQFDDDLAGPVTEPLVIDEQPQQ